MYVTLNGSELDMETKLNPNSQRSPCFWPLCAVIKGVCQHARPSYQFFRNFFFAMGVMALLFQKALFFSWQGSVFPLS